MVITSLCESLQREKMARKKVSDKKSKEIRRLSEIGLSKRKIALALNIHRRTVDRHLDSSIDSQSDTDVMDSANSWYDHLDWQEIVSESLKGVPAKILWQELKAEDKIPVTYCNFCRHLKKHLPSTTTVTMHRIFKPGERIEIDYCDGISIYDPIAGDIKKTHLFVGVLCYSRYAFAEFSFSQKSEDFLESHKNMFEYFGGVAQVLSPDNLKSAVTKTHRYDPDINQGYVRLANHYNCGVVPARVRSPKDKALVERTVQIFQKWYFYKVRKRTFTSLSELNLDLREALTDFNNKVHRIFKRSRAQMFADEKQHLNPLPEVPYRVETHRIATLHPDCHFSFEQNFYSAPHTYRGCKLDIWINNKTIEAYYQGERVAFHRRYYNIGKYVTNKQHYPESHRAYWDTTARALRTKASKAGPHISKLVHLLLSGDQPLRYIRRCQGIIRLTNRYEAKLVDKACEIAMQWEKHNLPFIEKLLKSPALLGTNDKKEKVKRGDNPYLRGRNFFEQGDSYVREDKGRLSQNEASGNDFNS